MNISPQSFVILVLLFFIIAAAYSSVGHAGASGYAAALALLNISPEVIRPTSLILNIAVGCLGLIQFFRADLLNFKKIFPFLIGSIPMAYLSASLTVDKRIFYGALGSILLISGFHFIFFRKPIKEPQIVPVNKTAAILLGGTIGLLSGITGTGGAIFLTPSLLLLNWASPREASGLSVIFVLTNSIFALAGAWRYAQVIQFNLLLVWIAIVLAGALAGTYFGIYRFSENGLKRILGGVLLIGGCKLLLNIFKLSS